MSAQQEQNVDDTEHNDQRVEQLVPVLILHSDFQFDSGSQPQDGSDNGDQIDCGSQPQDGSDIIIIEPIKTYNLSNIKSPYGLIDILNQNRSRHNQKRKILVMKMMKLKKLIVNLIPKLDRTNENNENNEKDNLLKRIWEILQNKIKKKLNIVRIVKKVVKARNVYAKKKTDNVRKTAGVKVVRTKILNIVRIVKEEVVYAKKKRNSVRETAGVEIVMIKKRMIEILNSILNQYQLKFLRQ